MKILVVEDDTHTREYLSRGLTQAGHSVDTAADGIEGLNLVTEPAGDTVTAPYDVLVVDRMLPRLDGLSMVRAMREAGYRTPILVLSALGEVDDRVKGLQAGGDDYLVKPFAFAELVARLEALVRRADPVRTSSTITVSDLELDLSKRRVTRAGQTISLQPREFRLLEFLMRHEDQVVTRTMLLEGVWDYHFDPQTNVVDVHVSRLRQKIDKPFDEALIHTVRGAGYQLSAQGPTAHACEPGSDG